MGPLAGDSALEPPPAAQMESRPASGPEIPGTPGQEPSGLPQPVRGPPSGLRLLRSRGRVRGVAALLGPAFVAAVAYIDPGNFATNFTAGAQFCYALVSGGVAA